MENIGNHSHIHHINSIAVEQLHDIYLHMNKNEMEFQDSVLSELERTKACL